jgi:membrane protein required for colicin V production
MHWFDIGVIVFLLLFGAWGLWRGLIREIMSLTGFIAAFVLAAHGYPYVAQLLADTITTEWLRQALSVALIFIAVMLVATVISHVLRIFLHAIGLSLLDRLLGGVFGALKVILVVSGLLIATGSWAPTFTKQLGTEAALAPVFFHTAEVLAMVLSQKDYTAFKHLSQQILQPLQQFIPGPQALPSAVDKLFSQPSAPPPAPPAAQRPGRQPGTAPTATQTPAPSISPPQAQEGPESSEGISEADSTELGKIVRERLQQR